jgi:hypothetical protein
MQTSHRRRSTHLTTFCFYFATASSEKVHWRFFCFCYRRTRAPFARPSCQLALFLSLSLSLSFFSLPFHGIWMAMHLTGSGQVRKNTPGEKKFAFFCRGRWQEVPLLSTAEPTTLLWDKLVARLFLSSLFWSWCKAGDAAYVWRGERWFAFFFFFFSCEGFWEMERGASDRDALAIV